jgi:DNA-binding XRE family transcriptional regulator
MNSVIELEKTIEETTRENACLISQNQAYFKVLQSRLNDFHLVSRNCVADIAECTNSRIIIIDTKVKDIGFWPAPLKNIPDSENRMLLFLVDTIDKAQYFESLHNSWCFNSDTDSIDRMVNLIRKRFKPEYSKIFSEVRLTDDKKSFFIRMENESKYMLSGNEIPEVDASDIIEYGIGDTGNYFWFRQKSGNTVEIPWDTVLYHCEQGYEYYKGKNREAETTSSQRIMKNIKSLRNNRGWTIAELAEKSGIQRPNLSRLENGKHTPSLETIIKVANALGVTVADIVVKK